MLFFFFTFVFILFSLHIKKNKILLDTENFLAVIRSGGGGGMGEGGQKCELPVIK